MSINFFHLSSCHSNPSHPHFSVITPFCAPLLFTTFSLTLLLSLYLSSPLCPFISHYLLSPHSLPLSPPVIPFSSHFISFLHPSHISLLISFCLSLSPSHFLNLPHSLLPFYSYPRSTTHYLFLLLFICVYLSFSLPFFSISHIFSYFLFLSSLLFPIPHPLHISPYPFLSFTISLHLSIPPSPTFSVSHTLPCSLLPSSLSVSLRSRLHHNHSPVPPTWGVERAAHLQFADPLTGSVAPHTPLCHRRSLTLPSCSHQTLRLDQHFRVCSKLLTSC